MLGSVQVLRLLIIFLVVFLSVPLLIDPTFKNIFAVLGALGLALGFALKDYASSLTAGMVAVYEIPYRLGDWVEINGRYGKVTSIGLRDNRTLNPGQHDPGGLFAIDPGVRGISHSDTLDSGCRFDFPHKGSGG